MTEPGCPAITRQRFDGDREWSSRTFADALLTCDGLRRLLINPHVIDHVLLRKDGVVDSLLSAPVSADGEVQDQVLLLVVWPGGRAALLVR